MRSRTLAQAGGPQQNGGKEQSPLGPGLRGQWGWGSGCQADRHPGHSVCVRLGAGGCDMFQNQLGYRPPDVWAGYRRATPKHGRC